MLKPRKIAEDFAGGGSHAAFRSRETSRKLEPSAIAGRTSVRRVRSNWMRRLALTLVCVLASTGCGSVGSDANARLFGGGAQGGADLDASGGAPPSGGETSACQGVSCGGGCGGSDHGCPPVSTTLPCTAPQKECDGRCADPSPGNGCGDPSCKPCPSVANAQPMCRGDACAFECDAGYVPQGAACNQAAPTCTDGVENGTETDVDCGGSCPECVSGKACGHGADCLTAACVNGACATASCDNGVQDSNETDIDCGGATCPKCATGLRCKVGADCAGGVCTESICLPSSCADHLRDGKETSVDCGGECAPCGLNATCLVDGDCASMHCAQGICRVPCSSSTSGSGCPACSTTATKGACCRADLFCGCLLDGIVCL